jgi:hypothetical protein
LAGSDNNIGGWTTVVKLNGGTRIEDALFPGAPPGVKTHAVTVLIGGKEVDLSNHQTELFRTYREKYGIQQTKFLGIKIQNRAMAILWEYINACPSNTPTAAMITVAFGQTRCL